MKPVKRLLKSTPAILALSEKHQDWQLFALSLKIAKARFDAKWYERPSLDEVDGRTDVTEAFLATLPDGGTKTRFTQEFKVYKHNLAMHEIECKEYDAFVKALDVNDGEAAFNWLYSRSDYEYEECSVTYPDTEYSC